MGDDSPAGEVPRGISSPGSPVDGGHGPERQLNSTWVNPPIGMALATVGLEDIRVYISCRHNTIAQYIAIFPIMDLCLGVEQSPGMWLSQIWWDQPNLYILWIIAAHASVEVGEHMGMEELEGDRYYYTEGQKEGGQLEEPDKIRRIFGGEVIRVACNPLWMVPNVPLASVPGKEYDLSVLGPIGYHGGQVKRDYRGVHSTYLIHLP